MTLMLHSDFMQNSFKPLEHGAQRSTSAGSEDGGRAFGDKLSECCREKKGESSLGGAESPQLGDHSAKRKHGHVGDSHVVGEVFKETESEAGKNFGDGNGADDAMLHNMPPLPVPFSIRMLLQNAQVAATGQGFLPGAQPVAQSGAQASLLEVSMFSEGKQAGLVVQGFSGKGQPGSGTQDETRLGSTSNSVDPTAAAKNAEFKETGGEAGKKIEYINGTYNAMLHNMFPLAVPLSTRMLSQNAQVTAAEQGSLSGAQPVARSDARASLLQVIMPSAGKQAGLVVQGASGKGQPGKGAQNETRLGSTSNSVDPATSAKNAGPKEGAVASQQQAFSSNRGEAAQARATSSSLDSSVLGKNVTFKEGAVTTQAKPQPNTELPANPQQNPVASRASEGPRAALSAEQNATVKPSANNVLAAQAQSQGQMLAQANQTNAPTSLNAESVRMSSPRSGASSSGGEGERQRGDTSHSPQLGSSHLKLNGTAAQKSENIRVFISRIGSALQQMRQENTSSVQLRLNLQNGEVIRIRLNLRGSMLRTVVHSENENTRNMLRTSWSDVTRALGEKGVEAENIEFENSAEDSSKQEEGFDQKAESAFVRAGMSRSKGESEDSDEAPVLDGVSTINEEQFFSRIA
jgi:hypothetical protein